jgi:hypothetical protein
MEIYKSQNKIQNTEGQFSMLTLNIHRELGKIISQLDSKHTKYHLVVTK